jgi:serine O-acetyltransferase
VPVGLSTLVAFDISGTGKDGGDRHPKVEANVLIGAGATVLGNITVGKGAQVAAGSLVLRDVPPKIMVAGSPARPVGKVSGASAASPATVICIFSAPVAQARCLPF